MSTMLSFVIKIPSFCKFLMEIVVAYTAAGRFSNDSAKKSLPNEVI